MRMARLIPPCVSAFLLVQQALTAEHWASGTAAPSGDGPTIELKSAVALWYPSDPYRPCHSEQKRLEVHLFPFELTDEDLEVALGESPDQVIHQRFKQSIHVKKGFDGTVLSVTKLGSPRPPHANVDVQFVPFRKAKYPNEAGSRLANAFGFGSEMYAYQPSFSFTHNEPGKGTQTTGGQMSNVRGSLREGDTIEFSFGATDGSGWELPPSGRANFRVRATVYHSEKSRDCGSKIQ